MDDRAVESLREVARVARRAAARRVGREADLVVRDEVERAAGAVAGERLEVERLRDDPLAGERGVAVEEDRERDARVGVAVARGAIGLLGARAALDDGIDRLEVARVGDERDRDVAGRRRARALRAEVVLHVAAAALLGRDDRLDRPLALELAEDDVVRPADDVREDVEAAAVRHPDHDLVRAGLGGEIDRLVEHRDHHVEAFDGELLLAEEGAPQVALHPLDLAQPAEQPDALVARQRPPVAARLDRLPQPDALLVVGEVLDLVRDRPRVRREEPRQRVGERLPLDVEAEERGGDARLQLGRELRNQAKRLERRIAGRLRAERVEPRVEVAVHADRLDERHRRGDAAEQLRSGTAAGAAAGAAGGGARRRGRRSRSGRAVPRELEQPREAGLRREHGGGIALEEVAPLLRHGAGVVEVLLEKKRGVARVRAVDLRASHCSSVVAAAAGATRARDPWPRRARARGRGRPRRSAPPRAEACPSPSPTRRAR